MHVESPIKLPGAFVLVASVVLLGYVVTTPHGPALIGAATAAVGFVALAVWSRAVTVAVLLLAILNGFPFIDFATFVAPGNFRPNDLFVVILVGLLILWGLSDARERTPRHVVLARWWALAFLGWWTLTLARSSLFDTIPILQASLFGRDFLYFGLLVPALVGVAWTREDVLLMARVLGIAGVVYAIAAIASSLGVASLSFITHPNTIATFEGLTRVYSPMNDVVILGFATGVGLAVLALDVKLRRLGWVFASLMGVAFALQLTRAAYLAALAAIVVMTGLWLYHRDAISLRLRPRVFSLLLCLVLVLGAVTLLGGSGGAPRLGAVSAVVNRATSSLSDVQSRGQNVGYRLDVAGRMRQVLGDQWPVGLGFWHPEYRYVPDLPDGSIRNSDLGVSNSLMTMGLIGTILLYLPALYTLVALQRARAQRRGADSIGWLGYGLGTWLLIVIAASATLATMFAVTGLVLVAFAVALGLRLTVWPDQPGPVQTPVAARTEER